MKLRTSCLRCTSGKSGVGSSLRKSLKREATVKTSCSRSRSTLSPLSHRCLSCFVLTTEPQRRNKPLCCIPATRQTKTFSHWGVQQTGGLDDGLKIPEGRERRDGKASKVQFTVFIQELHHVSQHQGYPTHHLPILPQRLQSDAKHTPGEAFGLWLQGGNNGLRANLRVGPQNSHWRGVVLWIKGATKQLQYRCHMSQS